MTLHAFVQYQCKSCSFPFVPFEELSECPKCGYPTRKRFNTFVEFTLKSASYNLAQRETFIPGGWGTSTVGDHYYWLAFQFLKFAAFTLKIPEKSLLGQYISAEKAQELSQKFVKRISFGKYPNVKEHFKYYFSRLLASDINVQSSLHKKENNKIFCFLSHSVKDSVFCEKLYSSLLAEGISCWYFPEDAKPGEKVWDEIDTNIRTCEKMIVVCSKHSLNSPAVIREIERALLREDETGTVILLPIRIDNYVLLVWEHSRKADIINKVIGDFTNWQDITKYDKSFKRLTDNLEKKE
jgi:hypothetical protein